MKESSQESRQRTESSFPQADSIFSFLLNVGGGESGLASGVSADCHAGPLDHGGRIEPADGLRPPLVARVRQVHHQRHSDPVRPNTALPLRVQPLQDFEDEAGLIPPVCPIGRGGWHELTLATGLVLNCLASGPVWWPTTRPCCVAGARPAHRPGPGPVWPSVGRPSLRWGTTTGAPPPHLQ